MVEIKMISRRGWGVMGLVTPAVAVEVVPGEGGDVGLLRRRASDSELLWQSPRSSRARGVASTSEDDVARLMEAYLEGWQTAFPNGGDAVIEHGVVWGMHGEVWLTRFDWEPVDNCVVTRARLVCGRFEVGQRVTFEGASLNVTKTAVTNGGGDPVEVMWGQHPASGAPLIGPGTVIDTAARTIAVDTVRNAPSADLALAGAGAWPHVPGWDGASVDLTRVPALDAGIDRFTHLSVASGHATIKDPRLGLRVALEWDVAAMPRAWYWPESNGSAGFPWYRGVYVLAIELATSCPGQGVTAACRRTGTQIRVGPGESRCAAVALTVAAIG